MIQIYPKNIVCSLSKQRNSQKTAASVFKGRQYYCKRVYPIARIVDTVESRDGKYIRIVIAIRIAQNRDCSLSSGKLLTRLMQRVCRLEINSDEVELYS